MNLIDGKRVYHRQVCACNALAGCTHPGHSPDTVTAPRVSAAACVCRACAHVGANRHGRVQDVHEVQGARVLRGRLSSLSTPLQDKPPPPATTGTRARVWRWREGATAEGVECGGEGGRNDQGSRGGGSGTQGGAVGKRQQFCSGCVGRAVGDHKDKGRARARGAQQSAHMGRASTQTEQCGVAVWGVFRRSN